MHHIEVSVSQSVSSVNIGYQTKVPHLPLLPHGCGLAVVLGPGQVELLLD